MRLLKVFLLAVLFASSNGVNASVNMDTWGQYLDSSSFSGLDWTNNDFTLTGWVYFDNAQAGHNNYFFEAEYVDNQNRLFVFRTTSETVCLWVRGGGLNTSDCTTGTYTSSTWYYWAVTYDSDGTGGTFNLYIDDMSTSLATLTMTSEPSGDFDYFGVGSGDQGNNMIGEMAYYKIWQRILTQSNLEDEENGAVMCDTTSAVSEYRFASGALGTDSQGSNTLTASGAVYDSNEPTTTGCPSVGAAVPTILQIMGDL